MNIEVQTPHYKSWSDVPKNLVSKTTLRNQKLKPGPVRGTVYQRSGRRNIELYDIAEAVPRKAPIQKQLQAIVKARAAMIALRTCSRCGLVLNQRVDGLCYYCERDQWLEGIHEEARTMMGEWVAHKDRYVILDTETTGLDIDAEIIEISIITSVTLPLVTRMLPLPHYYMRSNSGHNNGHISYPQFRDFPSP